MSRRRFLASAVTGSVLAGMVTQRGEGAPTAGFDSRFAVVSWDVFGEPKIRAQGRNAANSKVLGTLVVLRVRDPREDGSGTFLATVFGQFRRDEAAWQDCNCHPFYKDAYSYNKKLRDIQRGRNNQAVSFFLPNNAWWLKEAAEIRLAVRFYTEENVHLPEFDAYLPMDGTGHRLKPDDVPAETGEVYSLTISLPAGRPPVDVFSIQDEKQVNLRSDG